MNTLAARLRRGPALAALAVIALVGAPAALGTSAAHATTPAAHATTGKPQAAGVQVCGTPTPERAACLAEVQPVGRPTAAAAPATPPAGAGYGPADLRQAYNLTGNSTQTVALVDAYDDPTAESDLAYYRSQFGLPACTTANGCFSKVNQTGGSTMPPTSPANDNWATEISLDVDMVSAICPGCHILLVEATDDKMPTDGTVPNLYQAEDYATSHAKFVSNSWIFGEYAAETTDDVHFNHPGVAITAASGDNGFGVGYPSTSPYVVAVGGTTLLRASNARGWTESAWSHAGSGCSSYEHRPAWAPVITMCTMRATSDVSAVADLTNSPVVIYDGGAWYNAGGTSVASPIIASVYALAGTPGSSDNPATYPYAYPGQLNDVTSGSNGFCSPSPMCAGQPGWDGPTGLGTPATPTAFTSVHAWVFSSTAGTWMASNASANLPPGAVGTLSYDAPYVWARGADGHLRGYTQSGGVWSAVDVTAATGVAIAGDPEALGGNVYARDANGHLRQFSASGSTWVATDVTAATGVSITGDLSPQTGGGGYARDTSGHLRQFSVSGGVWASTDITAITGAAIVGNPSTNGGVTYARDTNNDLRQFYVSNGSWVVFDVTAATGQSVAGDPVTAGGVIYSRNAAGHLLQFYVSGGHWVYFDVSAATGLTIAGDPTTYNGDEYGRTAAGHLVEFYVSNSQWTTLNITTATGTSVAGDPVATSAGVLAS